MPALLSTSIPNRLRTVAGGVVALCCSWLTGLSVGAEETSGYLHRVWQVEEGLLNPAIRAIEQCDDGYLWLGTDGGLIRFDGVRFQEIEGRAPETSESRWIVGLIQARDGSIWTSSINGGITRLKDGEIIRYTDEEELPSNQVMAIHEDRAGTIWIGSVGGLTRYRDGAFHTYSGRDEGWLNQSVRTIAEDRTGNLWIGTTVGLNRLRDGTFTAYTTEDGLSGDSVMSLHVDPDDNIWVGTSDGVSVYDAGEETFRRYSSEDGLAHGVVRAIFQDSEGVVWIGSHGGLQQYHDGRFVDVALQAGTSPGLTGSIQDFVYDIFEDREKNLWVGTHRGLNQLSVNRLQTFSTGDGLPHESVTSVYQDSAGDIWIGTWGGGLGRVRDGEIDYWTSEDGLSSDYILGIYEDSRNNLWVGTDNYGLNRFSTEGDIVNHEVPVPPGLDRRAPNTVRLIFEDSSEKLWIGTNRGLFQFADGQFRESSSLVGEELPLIKTMVEDEDGVLWIGSGEGLTRVEGDSAVTFGREDGLSGLPVNAIFPDRNGLWVSTDAGGLDRFEQGRVTARLTEDDGLLAQRILHILADDGGDFWMSTHTGIYRTSRDGLHDVAAGLSETITAVSYGRADGMLRAQCNGIAQPSGWKDRAGRLWFPTIDGAVVLDPRRTPVNELPPPVLVEKVFADGVAADLSNGSKLPAGARNLRFQFTATSFQAPEKVRFRYRLEGFDSDWQDGGDLREAVYNNLRPGDYTFSVIAANNDGVWNTTGASVSVTVPPHFYETWWFYALGVLGLISTGAGLYRLRVRRMRHREKRLTALIDERTRKLKAEITERRDAQQRAGTLSKLGEKLCLVSTYEEAAEVIFEAADDFFRWDAACLFAYDAEEEKIHPIAAYDIVEGRRRSAVSGLEKINPSPAARRTIEEGGQLIFRGEATTDEDICVPFGDETRLSASIMYVPVRKGSETVGLLSVQSYTSNAYSKDDLDTLQSLGDYCAGALERIRAENALQESQEMVLRQERLAVVGQLSAGVAHEFNNILTIVQGHTSLIREDRSLNEETLGMLNEVSNGAERAAELTRQLLAFSRKQTMQPKMLDLNSIIEKFAGVLRRLLGENIVFEWHLQTDPPLLQADAGMMEQVIMNLAVNARDAMPKGGCLRITTRAVDVTRSHSHAESRPGHFICMEVADSGAGMDEATSRRIFEPFFSTKDVGKGTGLGLASVYGIVKQHQGWIEVSSRPGRGTTFRVYLPVADAPGSTAGATAASKPVRGGDETIFVVEDEVGVRGLIKMVLLRQGYRVIEAASGKDALRLWEDHRHEIDLLLTDMVMPGGISGGELAERLLRDKPGLGVIYISGYSAEVVKADQTLRKDITFLQKPYNPDKLTRIVRECLDAKGVPAN